MPIFEYKCKDCNKIFSKLTFNTSSDAECPDCKSKATERIISSIASTSGSSGGKGCSHSGFS